MTDIAAPQLDMSPIPASTQAGGELRALEYLHRAVTGTADVEGVQDCIGTALTAGLDFSGATVGLVDDSHSRITCWRRNEGGISGPLSLPTLLIDDGGPVAKAFRRPGRVVRGNLGPGPWALAALTFRQQPLGLLAVDVPRRGLAPERQTALERFASHAGEALAGVRMCVDRTRRLAVEAERTRISIEMHDAVIQSLFAITCMLEGCARAAEGPDPDQARRLDDCRRLAEKTLTQVRESIYDLWPAELLERQFLGQLRSHLTDLTTTTGPLELEWEARGHLADLSRETRHILLCVAQEGISNVVRHANARRVEVVLDAGSDPIRLQVTDDGCGMSQDQMRPQFGIRGMRARLASLGGSLDLGSEPGRGTELLAVIPRALATGGAGTP